MWSYFGLYRAFKGYVCYSLFALGAIMPTTIALVDDDLNILTSLSIALEAEGYRIATYQELRRSMVLGLLYLTLPYSIL
jgi:hypothetical protein